MTVTPVRAPADARRARPKPRPRTDGRRVFPLSFAQARLWFLNRLQPGSPTYNIPYVTRLPGPVDAKVLERAINEIARRHEALRTTFDIVDRKPAQIVAPSLDVTLHLVDLRSIPASSREAEAQRVTFEECRTEFDLSAGPLIRATLIEINPTDHVLIVVVHHIVCDGWSMGILYRELAALYGAFIARRPSPLPELTLQYADYAEWQLEWFNGAVLQDQLGYWRTQLEGLKPLLPMPTDRPRPPVQAHRGEFRTFFFDAPLCDLIKGLAQSEGATLFMTTLAAFCVLLHRYTGETDIAVGTPIANRTTQELEQLIGFFVNTLVLRVRMDGDPTFRQLLRSVREIALDAYAHQDMPFEKLVEELQPERNASHNPLFQIMFAVQNIAAPDRNEPSRAPAAPPPLAANGTSKFDLTVPLYDTGRTIEGAVEYNSDLFDASTIAEMIERFETLLRGIAYDPDAAISRLPVAAERELRELERGWPGAPAEPLPFESVGEAVRAHATQTPDAIALITPDGRRTYADIDARARNLAAHLLAAGLSALEPVLVATARAEDRLIAFLAVMEAGGVFVIVDPQDAAARIAHIVDHAAARIAITDDATAEHVLGIAEIIDIDRGVQASGLPPDDGREAARTSARRDVAGIVYRSAPSGKPEAVPITHESLLRIGGGAALGIAPGDRVAHASTLLEDSALLELFAPLVAGATAVLLPSALSPRALAEAIREHEITVTFASAANADRLAREFPWAFRSLRLVLCVDGPGALKRLRESFRPEIADRLHGLTGAVDCGWYAIQPLTALSALEESDELPIGVPMPGVTLHLLDGSLRPVPPGMCGEIFVARDGLAPAGPAFVANPLGSREPLLYRTGEHGRRGRDGTLLPLGRRDQRLQVRGVRVEAEEVRVALMQHDAVSDAAVIGHRNGLMAFVVAAEGSAIAPDELRAFAQELLPKVMVPAKIETLAALPRLPGGAIDHRALAWRAQFAERSATAPRPHVAPRNAIEERLARYWSEIFALQQVSVHDNFFEIGGHSLLATQVIARLKDETGVDLPLQRLFDAPTIAELAQILEPLVGANEIAVTAAPAAPPLVRIPRGKPLPLSFAQQRLWFLDQFEPGSAFYNISVNVPLPGPLDLHGLRAGINDLVRRHEPLRTTFTVVGNAPVQIIAPSLTIDIPHTDLSRLEPGARKAEAQRIATVEAQTPFDLGRGPVIRAQVLTLDENEHILLLTIHHIATDGWSMDILFRELDALRESHRTGRNANLPELLIQYADFAIWQRQWLTGDVLEQQLSWWKTHLDGAPALLELPTDRPRPGSQSFRGAMHTFELSPALAHAVRGLAESERATLFMALFAAFGAILHRHSGVDDLVVGTPIANRTRPELEPLIGFFANTLPLRVRIGPDFTFRDLLVHVREVSLGAYAHQDIPFEQLVEELQPERSLAYNPIFQVMVALQNIGMPGEDDAGVSPLSVGNGIAKFDLTLFLTEARNIVHCGLEYNTDLFDEGTIRRMAGHFESLLSAALAEPDRPLATLPLLRPWEVLQLQEWNATERRFAAECVHRLFEMQAERTPDACALQFGDKAVSYRELNARANFEAHRLIQAGVKPGSLVAVSMERGVPAIVAVLAVLKAGAGYVPVDPHHPPDRVALILEDARVSAVLANDTTRGARDDRPRVDVTPDDLAYVIYTSGSTGTPKGVAMPHRPLANLVAWQIGRSALPAGARTLQFASLGFDVSFQEIFTTLCAGGTLVLIGEEDRRDPATVWTLIRDGGVNRLFLPYVALQQLAEQAASIRELPRSLVEVITAGEQLQVTPQIAALFARLGCPLYNQYGPSETHVVTELALSADPTQWPARPAIGRPIANATIHILDAQQQAVPAGVPGEIYLGGVALARGYLHNPEMTKARFVGEPGGGAAARGRLYRTGDRGRFLADGTVEFLGRLDTQVKIRGFRIEPAEIETALREHPAVREAAVVARRGNGAADTMLVAYVQPDREHPPSARDLRGHLSRTLPEHMIPSAFVLLDRLPLTPTGKIDRRSLPDPDGATLRDEVEFIAPRTPVESTIAAIWCDLLRLSRAGVRENFFDLGGQSLVATRMLARVNEELNVQLPLRRVFEQPTIEALAMAVLQANLERQDEGVAADLLAQLEALPDDSASA